MGIIFIVIAAAIWVLFIRTLKNSTDVATYGMTLNV